LLEGKNNLKKKLKKLSLTNKTMMDTKSKIEMAQEILATSQECKPIILKKDNSIIERADKIILTDDNRELLRD